MNINDKLEGAKRKLADKLSKGSERFSTKTKKRAIVLTGLLCATICVTLIVLPFLTTRNASRPFKAATPVVIHPQKQSPLPSIQEYQLLEGFIQTLDSLKRIDNETYQKAITGREGMIDSILFLLRHSGQALIKK